MSRYFPPIGTAGFDRIRVSGKSRLPAPPPRMSANTLRIESNVSQIECPELPIVGTASLPEAEHPPPPHPDRQPDHEVGDRDDKAGAPPVAKTDVVLAE